MSVERPVRRGAEGVAQAVTPDDFEAFFQAVWGHPPFEWQSRLAERVCRDGWPAVLDLPTGSGKTAALDIAVFALAADAAVEPEARRQPRRIVLVVDRRTVVDQAYERASRLAEALQQAKDGVVCRVAAALRALQGDPEALPLLPAILRGGMPREVEWARAPHQPVVLVSTVDQVGSRLLFRGYGVSDRMRPIHAGLLGRDTLYLLDEVHLSRPFEETLAAVRRYARCEQLAEQLPRPLEVVRMSATVADPHEDTFTLQESERTPCSDSATCGPQCGRCLLARRLGAAKRALLHEVTTPKDPVRAREALAKACIREVDRLGRGSARAIAVVVNRVDTARRVARMAANALKGGWDVRLVTGRMRPLDRDDLRGWLSERVAAGRSRPGMRVLLVATQAIEAGADFDLDALVTEHASLDALRQRFGRLDRLGELQATEAVVLAASRDVEEGAAPDPIYGEALRATWCWLQEHAEQAGENGRVVDFGVLALDARLAACAPAELRALLAPRAVAPVLTRSHLDRWVQTSPSPSADPDVADFLHGPDRGAPEVQVVWRADIDLDAQPRPGELERIVDMLGVVPPSALESLSVPLWSAKSWLAGVADRRQGETRVTTSARVDLGVADVEGAPAEADEQDATIAPVLRWRGEESSIARNTEDLRPGDVLVAPAVYGGLDATFVCWDPEASDPVRDRGDEAHLRQRGRAVVRWHRDVLEHGGLGRHAGQLQVTEESVDEDGAAAEDEAFEAWGAAVLDDPDAPPWVRIALKWLGSGRRTTRLGEGHELWRATSSSRRVPLEDVRALAGLAAPSIVAVSAAPTTEDDASSFTSVEVTLERHLAGTRAHARRFAEALALPEGVAGDVELAAWIHDLGKADPRFQMMLHGGDAVAHAVAPELLAKSSAPATDRGARERARQRAGYPRGTRHELMSIALVAQSDALRERARDWELVLHLVASHHGWCRPFAPAVVDREPVDVTASLDGMTFSASSDHRLVRLESGIVERFWRLVRAYGWWGLAWLEAILRLADHRESEKEAAGG